MKAKCPICRKMAITEFRPFCSKRCADIDLGRWLGERYAITQDDPDAEIEVVDNPPQDDER